MKHQRQRRKGSGDGGPLSDEQIQLLDEVNFPWDSHAHADKWNAKYQELAEFHKKNGHLRVEYRGSLHTWIRNQRNRRKGTGTGGPLTDEQIKMLDELDFEWDGHASVWNAKYQELADFYKKHGHLKVEYKGSLYQWMKMQQQRRKGVGTNGPLTDEQIKMLDELDFEWDPKSRRKQR